MFTEWDDEFWIPLGPKQLKALGFELSEPWKSFVGPPTWEEYKQDHEEMLCFVMEDLFGNEPEHEQVLEDACLDYGDTFCPQ